jgi:biotin carboxyl carrier protein
MRCTVRIDDQTYQIELGDLRDRPIVALVDGVRVEVWPDERRDHIPVSRPVKTSQEDREPATSAGASRLLVPTYGKRAAETLEIRAPLPGLIKEVLVKPGDEVNYGQELCVIEAMKMKNIIRAARAGKIAEISVYSGQTVNHNDTLMTFAE